MWFCCGLNCFNIPFFSCFYFPALHIYILLTLISNRKKNSIFVAIHDAALLNTDSLNTPMRRNNEVIMFFFCSTLCTKRRKKERLSKAFCFLSLFFLYYCFSYKPKTLFFCLSSRSASALTVCFPFLRCNLTFYMWWSLRAVILLLVEEVLIRSFFFLPSFVSFLN